MRFFKPTKIFAGAVLLAACSTTFAGAIFLTGHDPDFHALLGSNAPGAIAINNAAIDYIMSPTFNPFVSTAPKFLFVESNIPTPGGHSIGMDGILASGYSASTFDQVNASGLNAALDILGKVGGYSGIVIASDFGGLLTQAELNILDARSMDIISFLNDGGGLYAMAESNNGAGLTPDGGQYGFLPFIVTSTSYDHYESGNTVTAFGSSLGLTNSDLNGNASHNYFTSTGGMDVVDYDPAGHILSLATRSKISTEGVVPEPTSIVLLGLGLAAVGFISRRKRLS